MQAYSKKALLNRWWSRRTSQYSETHIYGRDAQRTTKVNKGKEENASLFEKHRIYSVG